MKRETVLLAQTLVHTQLSNPIVLYVAKDG